MQLNDARTDQILFLALFLILGIGTRDWTLRPGLVAVAIATCLVTQGLAFAMRQWWSGVNDDHFWSPLLKSLPSALITALGLSLLLRADHYGTLFLASALAVLSKFLLRVQDKHIFNPANFGIIAALILTPDAWVSPGQWGEEGWYTLLFLGSGGLVLKRVGRWDTSVAFLTSYALLEAVRNLWLGWSWDVWGHRLTSGSLLLFALFMVTDPRTIPNARIGRIVWATAIALLTFVLRNYCFIPSAVFWALFVLAPLTPVLDLFWPAPRFHWGEQPAATPEPYFQRLNPAGALSTLKLSGFSSRKLL